MVTISVCSCCRILIQRVVTIALVTGFGVKMTVIRRRKCRRLCETNRTLFGLVGVPVTIVNV